MKFLPILLFLMSIVAYGESDNSRNIASVDLKVDGVDSSSQYSDYVKNLPQHKGKNPQLKAAQIRGTAKIEKETFTKKGVYFLYGAEHLKLKNYYFDFPVVYNDKVKRWMNYFLNRGKDFFVRYSERSGRYAPVLGKILEEFGLPRDLIFLAMAESGFQNKAKSWAKAVGPWQFMPRTGRRYGLRIDWHVDERRDPIKATIAAAKYLKDLYDLFGSWEIAAAAYNAGEGKLGRAIKRYKTENFWKISEGRYLARETKNYVPKIMALAIIGKNLSSFGFHDIDFHEPLDFDEILIPPGLDLVKVSEILEVPFSEIQRLNPEVLRWYLPESVGSYILRVPVGYKGKKDLAEIVSYSKISDFKKYEMRSHADLRAVSRKFKVPVNVLSEINRVSAKKRLKRGSQVLLPFRKDHNHREPMYADLYEKPRRVVGKWRKYRKRIRRAIKRGNKITNPTVYYTVKKGDTLWRVSKKTGVSLDTIIRTNLTLVKSRMIREGDRLAVR